MKISVAFFLSFFHIFSLYVQRSELLIEKNDTNVLKLAFGSCNKFVWDDESDIFHSIKNYHPDLFMWIGDAAYIEDMILWFVAFEFPGVEKARKRLFNSYYDPAYQALKNETKIIGVWDNHDYGQDWGHHSFPYRKEMQEVFLDFVEESPDSPRRKQAGIYDYYDINFGRRTIRIILLDVRYHKNPEKEDTLGDDQWAWLESLFKTNDKDLVLIASGSQILSEDRMFHDTWFSPSKYRLLNLIKDYSIPAILFTGDIHQGEIQMIPESDQTLGYKLYEITSSGMTHTSKTQFTHGYLIDKLFFPFTYNENGEDDRFLDLNYGSFEIKLGEKESQDEVRIQVRDIDNEVKLERVLLFEDFKNKNINKSKEFWKPKYPNIIIFAINWLNYTFFDSRMRVLWPFMSVVILIVFYLLFSFYLTCCYFLCKAKKLIFGLVFLLRKKKKKQQGEIGKKLKNN